jgi:ribonuclease HII
MLELGIDDAGRGPVIGPMILAGCLITEDVGKQFKISGVKDSKQLTQKRREFLEQIVKEKADAFEVVVVSTEEIDGNVNNGKLNELEAVACAQIINKINKGFGRIKVILDCPSTNIGSWRDFLMTKIENLSNLEIVCEHKADVNHVSVSAASILAKSERERQMAILKEKYGAEIGSGYSSDPYTQKFVEKHATKLKDSGVFRKSWDTWKNAVGKGEQKKLGF